MTTQSHALHDSARYRVLNLLCNVLQRLEADYKAVTDAEKAEVVKLGGLHVVGTERHVRGAAPNALQFQIKPGHQH